MIRMPESFYTEAQPCESCGTPTYRAREWNAEHELWVAVDCQCSVPDEPIAPCMIEVLEAAQTVNELMETCKAHLQTCLICNPKLRQLPKRETERRQEREAA
jgi:hypothetical protein